MPAERLASQIAFLAEADKLKNILRRTVLIDDSRRENSAEHSWHLTLCAMTLLEYAAEPVDLLRVMKMLVVHDLVEIDAGDTFAHDPVANETKRERELRAAQRIFGLLPSDLAAEVRGLWEDFEVQQTFNSRYANAIDRIQPFFQNIHNRGGTWRIYGVTREQVLARMEPIRTAMPSLWPVILDGIAQYFSEQEKGQGHAG